jgi:L-ribulose-5-phosphate 4-epimerase
MNNLILETVAKMALISLELNPKLRPLHEYILRKHNYRKHGPEAYYGQKKK